MVWGMAVARVPNRSETSSGTTAAACPETIRLTCDTGSATRSPWTGRLVQALPLFPRPPVAQPLRPDHRAASQGVVYQLGWQPAMGRACSGWRAGDGPRQQSSCRRKSLSCVAADGQLLAQAFGVAHCTYFERGLAVA